MKKVFTGLIGFIVIAAAGVYLFRQPLMETVGEGITANMFVSVDSDAFDPGLAIGDTFPALLARYRGKTITDMGEFLSDKGMIFIANRSVDW